MKKFLSLLAMLGLLFSFGCGGGGDAEPAEDGDKPAEGGDKPAEEGDTPAE